MGQGVLPGCAVIIRRPGDPDPLILKPAPSYPGMLAGDDGSIWSVRGYGAEPHERKTREHATSKSVPRRYVSISKRNGRPGDNQSVPAYKIVADAWHGPSNGLSVDHVNGNPNDDRPANLQYLTMHDNNSKQGPEMTDDDWEEMIDA